jgi:hypothetical protein
MAWRYHYPCTRFPYEQLVAENGRRSRSEPEYELLDTGCFADGYWRVDVEYAKHSPDDVVMHVVVTNVSSEPRTIHVLPTLWLRNTWSWEVSADRPQLHGDAASVEVDHPAVGPMRLTWSGAPTPLYCENETNTLRLYGTQPVTPYPKDGINDHVVTGAPTVNPQPRGTKAALWYQESLDPGATAEMYVRLYALDPGSATGAAGADFARNGAAANSDERADHDAAALMTQRRKEADDFYGSLTPAQSSPDQAEVMRQAFAGLLWSKQFYHFDVARWLDGDPGQPAPPGQRRSGRNHRWRHLRAADIIVMPDDWEYPWVAAWDLAFHAVVLAHVDPEMAKDQLLLLTHEWYMSSRGQLPAYEWEFSDVNPPVHPLAVLRVFDIDGGRDYDWLTAMFNKLLVNFTWWMNREDVDGQDVFAGGFLGLDNIAPFDRDKPPPDLGGRLVQVDGTAWVALAELGLLAVAVRLAEHQPGYGDVAVKFFEHFWAIAFAIDEQKLWDDADGLYYSVVRRADGTTEPIREHSIDGLLPLAAFAVIPAGALQKLPTLRARVEWFVREHADVGGLAELVAGSATGDRLMSVVTTDRLVRLLERMLGTSEFLSPYGIRSVSRWHREHPLAFGTSGVLDYEPSESTSALFGGNSNWRGPVWFPLNYLLINALARLDEFYGSEFTVELPTGSGVRVTLMEAARLLGDRLVSLFTRDEGGRRPCYGESATLQGDPAWSDQVLFHEYFDGETGAGLGASHQTGWTALVADLITSQRFERYVSDSSGPYTPGGLGPRQGGRDDLRPGG